VTDKETDIESGVDLLCLNQQFSGTQNSINRMLDRQVEGMLMEDILPAGSMKRYVHRVGEMPAYLLKDISSARMDERHRHLDALMDEGSAS